MDQIEVYSDDEETCELGWKCLFCRHIDGGYCRSSHVVYTVQCVNCNAYLNHPTLCEGTLKQKIKDLQLAMWRSSIGRHLRRCCGSTQTKNLIVKVL